MIGERGWTIRFDVQGGTQREMQKEILARLNAFWPGEADDDGWRLDVDVAPHVHTGSGDVLTYEGAVVAQRVKVRSATDHGHDPAAIPAGQAPS